MPDNVKDERGMTGEMPRMEVEPDIEFEPIVPPQNKSNPPVSEPSTGMMAIITEARDETAERDKDKPTQ